MTSSREIEAIESTDTDELLRIIDGHCKAAAWSSLIDLRSRCREALAKGKQLWGVEEHIRYRLALEAPADIAGPVTTEGPARFTLGPLSEVVASTKTWAQLDPNLAPGPIRASVAAERVVRGDIVDGEPLELPGRLMGWEPVYPVAKYRSDGVDADTPRLSHLTPVVFPAAGEAIADHASEGALADIVLAWTDESNGRAQTVTVSGDHAGAIAALGMPSARVGRLDPAEALSWISWAAASGGAHGRRRGAAAGRHSAWWVVANLGDIEWPASPDDVGSTARRLTWHWFDDGSPDTGWRLRLAIADPDNGLAWALSASDDV